MVNTESKESPMICRICGRNIVIHAEFGSDEYKPAIFIHNDGTNLCGASASYLDDFEKGKCERKKAED